MSLCNWENPESLLRFGACCFKYWPILERLALPSSSATAAIAICSIAITASF